MKRWDVHIKNHLPRVNVIFYEDKGSLHNKRCFYDGKMTKTMNNEKTYKCIRVILETNK